MELGPTICRLKLGADLRQLREARSLRLEDVATKLEVAPSTLSRIETGKAPTRVSYLTAMLDLYQVADPQQRKLMADMARQSRGKGWWADCDDLLAPGMGVLNQDARISDWMQKGGEKVTGNGGQVAAAWQALGRQLAASRRAAGLNQERLAALADYSRSTVANVETGRQHVGPEFWTRCDDVLRTGDALRRGHAEVIAVERAHRAQAVGQARYDSLAVAFDGAADPDGPRTGAGPELVIRPVRDPLVVAELAGALPGYARAAAVFGGGDVLPLILRHVRLLHAGLDSVGGEERRRLVEACARYGEFAGWLCQDLGRIGDAMFWSDRALDWARESGDDEFVSYVLMRHSDRGADL